VPLTNSANFLNLILPSCDADFQLISEKLSLFVIPVFHVVFQFWFLSNLGLEDFLSGEVQDGCYLEDAAAFILFNT
jgi:hypothetical protein